MPIDEQRAAWLRGVKEACDAELDGHEVECSGVFSTSWKMRTDPCFFDGTMYRKKPKPKPKYRPFTRNEIELHERQYIIHESDTIKSPRRSLVGTYSAGVWIVNIDVLGQPFRISFAELLARYTFENGTPCGVLAEADDE